MRNRTSSGDLRRAEAGRAKKKYMSQWDAISLYCRAEERIRPYLDQAQWVAIDRLTSQLGWEQAAYQIDCEYMLMRKHAREAARLTLALGDPCICTPNSDWCPTCSETIQIKYGDEIPFESQP